MEPRGQRALSVGAERCVGRPEAARCLHCGRQYFSRQDAHGHSVRQRLLLEPGSLLERPPRAVHG